MTTTASLNINMLRTLCVCVVVFVCYFRVAEGHGHLVDPPSRSSMWQEGFRTPPNYNQNQLNCGGFYNHYVLNNGKCGICGDPYQSPTPRDNESGGKYGKGIITRTYSQGQKVTIRVLITANHMGWFEFKLCPNGSPSTPVTQACLDKYVLPLADGSGTRYSLGPQERSVSMDVMLPQGVICTQCVLQWRWRAGNNFGRDPDGTTCKGCGNQEEFYGCSDIAITSGNGGQPQGPITVAPITVATTRPTIATTPKPQTTAAPPIVTFPPITLPHYTNNVLTYGTNYPTMRPINFPLFTTASTARPTAPPMTTNRPITTPTRPVVPGSGARVTLPGGFVPISINPTFAPVRTNPPPITMAPIRTNPPITMAPIRTNPPVTMAPIRTNPPYIPQTPRPTFFRPPTTPSRLQLITTPKPRPTLPNIFNPQTTQPPHSFTLAPFTLFPPFFGNNNNNHNQQTTPFYRPPTTQRPVFTQPKITTPFYRPPTTQRPLFTRPKITTPFYRPPTTTQRPVFTTRPQTTAPTTTFYRPPTTQPARQVKRCVAINSWKGVGELQIYCQIECNISGGVCPPAFCSCLP